VARLPPQGGLAPDGAVGAVLEVACDESGFSGRNLLDPATPVLTHASVDLTGAEAAALLAGLGTGPAAELKSGRFLRGPSATVDRFLGALAGRAHVHRIDKELFLATRVVDLFLAEPTYAAGTRLTAAQRPAAVALRRSGAGRAVLAAYLDVVPTKRGRRVDPAAVDRFLRAGAAVGLQRVRVEGVLDRLTAGDPAVPPPLEPVLPALAETVLHWSAGGARVLVTHDEQSALTAGRLRALRRVLGPEPSPLAGVLMVDSRDDPRVQVADLLAGVARRVPDLGPVSTSALG
jgi:hypothetical protein